MSDKPETIADIIAEMRDLGKLDEKSIDKIPRALMGLGLRTYSDRLEAAHMRETPGNTAKLREALVKCSELAQTIWLSNGGEDVSSEIAELKDTIDAALAAPPRNCDVGPAEK